jgi:hypothetical protein
LVDLSGAAGRGRTRGACRLRGRAGRVRPVRIGPRCLAHRSARAPPGLRALVDTVAVPAWRSGTARYVTQTVSVPEQTSIGQSGNAGAQPGPGISEFIGKVLDQLSLSAWLPAVMLVGAGALHVASHDEKRLRLLA